MKRIIAVFLTILALSAIAIEAKSETQFASGGLIIGLSEPGTANCVGGSPSGLFFRPCSRDTKVTIWRNFVGAFSYIDVTGDAAPFFSGTWASPGSCNLDENLAGHCWGTIEGDALGGKWEGTWNGKLDFINFGGDLGFVGNGTGGGVEGLHMKMEAAMEGTGDPTTPMPFTARVLKIEE